MVSVQEANSEEEVEERIAGWISLSAGKLVSRDHAVAIDGVAILINSWVL